MIGPFRLRSIAVIGGVALLVGCLLALARIEVPVDLTGTPDAEATRYVTDPNATGPLVGSIFTIPHNQPLATGGVWGDAAALNGGTLIVLDLFATWCPPCQQETPILRSLDRDYRSRGLRIVGVSVSETPEIVAAYAQRYSLGYPLLVDADGALFRAAQAGGLPTKILLDANGRVLAVLPRPFVSDDGAALIEPLIAPTP